VLPVDSDRDLLARLGRWLTEAIEKTGEDLSYAASIAVAQEGPVFMVLLTLPGAIINSTHNALTPLTIGADEHLVDHMVRDALEALLQARSASLAAGNGHLPEGILPAPQGWTGEN